MQRPPAPMFKSNGRRCCASRATSPDPGRRTSMTTGSLTQRNTVDVGGWTDRPGIAVWLFVAPCLIYLAAFAIYPLVYSLRLSFTDLTAADGTGRWIGLRNYI